MFEMPSGDLSGVPEAVPPASFAQVGALEVQHIERWIAARPDLLGEQLLAITTQFAGFDKTKDRSDILALDEAGKLVVIELRANRTAVTTCKRSATPHSRQRCVWTTSLSYLSPIEGNPELSWARVRRASRLLSTSPRAKFKT